MPDTGWVVCTAAEDVASGADASWTNVSNLTAEDDAYATITLNPTQTARRIQGHTFNLSGLIPAGATIDGIEFRFSAKTSTSTIGIADVVLIDPDTGNPVGDDKGSGSINTTEAFYTFGGAADKWNWTDVDRAQLIANGFKAGVKFATNGVSTLTISVDSIQVKIYYTEAVTPQLDMWEPRVSQPLFRPGRARGIDAACITEPTLFTAPPEVSWFSPTSEPVRTVRQPPRIPGVFAAEPADFPQIEEITVDKWFSPTSEPVRVPLRIQPLPGVYQGEPGDFVVLEEIFPDKWWQPTATPPRGAPRSQPTPIGTPGQIDPTIITMPDMDWLKPVQEPVRRVPRAQPTVTAYTAEQGQLPAIFAQWYQPTGVPVRPPVRSPVTEGDYPFVPLTVIAPFDWRQPLSEPARRTISAAATTGTYPLESGQTASYELSWFVQASEPVGQSPFAQGTTGQMPLEPSLLAVPDMDWITQPAELPRVAPRAQPTVGELGSQEPFLPSAFTVCVEMQPPVRFEARAQVTTGESHVDPTLFVVPDSATWWQPLSIPVLEPRLPVAAVPATSFTVWIVGDAVLDVGLEWSADHERITFSKRFRHGHKTPGSIYDGEADFSELLEDGELLTGAPSYQISPNDGLLVVSGLAASTTAIAFVVSGGRDMVRYKLTFRSATDAGETLELVCIMHVQGH